MTQPVRFILITADPEEAAEAVDAGVDLVMVDFEWRGKGTRQSGSDLPMNHHSQGDLIRILRVVPADRVVVRINPWGPWTADEADQILAVGARTLMLPMVETVEALERVGALIRPAARLIALLETRAGIQLLNDAAQLGRLVDSVYFGFNDLRLSFGWALFTPLANGSIDRWSSSLRDAGIPFGFGGIGRIGQGEVPPELILAEHLRQGSRMVILSRTFRAPRTGPGSMRQAVYELRQREAEILALSVDERELLHRRLIAVVAG